MSDPPPICRQIRTNGEDRFAPRAGALDDGEASSTCTACKTGSATAGG
ncbi:hypothetical protein [Prosthecobacter sp.]